MCIRDKQGKGVFPVANSPPVFTLEFDLE
jgi:hypothetical protein